MTERYLNAPRVYTRSSQPCLRHDGITHTRDAFHIDAVAVDRHILQIRGVERHEGLAQPSKLDHAGAGDPIVHLAISVRVLSETSAIVRARISIGTLPVSPALIGIAVE